MSVEDTTEAVLEEIVKSEEIDKEDPTPSLVVTGNGLEEATNRDEFETLEDQSTKSFPQRVCQCCFVFRPNPTRLKTVLGLSLRH